MRREIFGPECLPYRQEKQMWFLFQNQERFFLSITLSSREVLLLSILSGNSRRISLEELLLQNVHHNHVVELPHPNLLRILSKFQFFL
jgi:hypothetical protein